MYKNKIFLYGTVFGYYFTSASLTNFFMVESGDEHCLNAASRILLVFKTPLADGIALYFSVPPAEFLSALAHLLGYCTLL